MNVSKEEDSKTATQNSVRNIRLTRFTIGIAVANLNNAANEKMTAEKTSLTIATKANAGDTRKRN